MSLTNFARNKILDKNFGGVAYTEPSSFFVGLSTTQISTTGSNATEPSGAGYARVEIPNDKSSFSYAASGCVVNNNVVNFVISSGSWGTIVNAGLWDNLTSGSLWYFTSLSPVKVVQDATIISISTSALAISM